MSTEAPAVYHASPYPAIVHQAARHRAAGGNLRLPVLGWVILGVLIVALAAAGVLFAL
ncbi:hypothetical protein [Virgisporangium aurantiacum]|nr:hypothetical protein [Virgisporangium aurantiacum]